ncbi:cupredoxin family protein [Herbaspirillum sp.]|uniref:cupredoxin domain-containing protein n=1 Tax=Herbaspirillum sp. TaxID=1890675 RepID=UPI001B29EFB1|nr:cupredoxin family protein [Herbaspirillum sp.]MBO9538481.1 cupredoxin family protein [Herbaspirillum sp.]
MKLLKTSASRLLAASILAAALPLPALAAGMEGMPHAQHQHAGEDDAIGRPGQPGQAARTVKVDMTDGMRFSPASVQVKQGETIRFVVTNSGKLRHELVLGSADDLKAHYAAMLKNPDMEHADANQVTLDGGKHGELLWQFDRAGTVQFGCLQPGHYDAGMKGSVTVAASRKH